VQQVHLVITLRFAHFSLLHTLHWPITDLRNTPWRNLDIESIRQPPRPCALTIRAASPPSCHSPARSLLSLTHAPLANHPLAEHTLSEHTAEKPRHRIDTASATPHYPRLGVLRESDIRRTTLHQYGRITLPENRWKWDSLHTPYSYNASLTFNKLTPFSSWSASTTDSNPSEINSATCCCVIFERKP
jgi:hypothetical protein